MILLLIIYIFLFIYFIFYLFTYFYATLVYMMIYRAELNYYLTMHAIVFLIHILEYQKSFILSYFFFCKLFH